MYLNKLDPKHLQELATDSGIDLALAGLNFQSLKGDISYEYLLNSARLNRTNTGKLTYGWLRRYRHLDQGGWWCSGLDPLNHWNLMDWGCFKPNYPRLNQDGKIIKYEHPPQTPTRIFCLRVNWQIWQKISGRYHVAMPDEISQKDDGETLGFWSWVVTKNLPIILCEGVKKAAALLSQGYVAIALPGINSGYRVNRNDQGQVINRKLIPDLAVFTQKNRTFYLCFDWENQPKKIKAVNQAIAQIGQLLQAQKCQVKVIRLPGLEKGVDDFIVSRCPNEFDSLYDGSLDLESDLAKNKPHSELTYPPDLILHQRYLEKIPFPTAGLVGVKSAKGTGKTTALTALIQDPNNQNRPILILTHRIQLGQFLCDRLGVDWIHHHDRETPSQKLGLCFDSLWKIDPNDWMGGIIILDEIEQSLWHLLNSDTCKQKRIQILAIFQQLIAIVLQTEGLVIAQDADLSDLSLDYLKGLAGSQIAPWILVNEWKPLKNWDVTFYDCANPTMLIHQLELDLKAGKKCYVATDSRGGRYSCELLDRYIKQRLESLVDQYPKTLIVSAHTTTTPNHEAVNFVKNINENAKNYDAVFVTPTLSTGVSIDVEHFQRVYGIFVGVISDLDARQALARVRANVPRIIWCAKRGIGLIGSGSKNYRVISHWYQENHQENLALISLQPNIDVDLPLIYDPIHLRTWSKLAARLNASLTFYRLSMLEGLKNEGYQVNLISDAPPTERIQKLRQTFLATPTDNWSVRAKLIREIVQVQNEFTRQSKKSKSISNQIKNLRTRREIQLANAVANAVDLTESEYQQLLAKRYLTDQEREQRDKYILHQRYGVKVTAELKLRDDQGYYSQLILHYYLTHECNYFQLRDLAEWSQHLDRGKGKVFLPDLTPYTLKIEALRVLGVLKFLDLDRYFRETDSDLIALQKTAQECSKHIQRCLGINIFRDREKEQLNSVKILSLILKLLGIKLKFCQTIKNERELPLKVYQIDPLTFNDGRAEIFAIWQQREMVTDQITSGDFSLLAL